MRQARVQDYVPTKGSRGALEASRAPCMMVITEGVTPDPAEEPCQSRGPTEHFRSLCESPSPPLPTTCFMWNQISGPGDTQTPPCRAQSIETQNQPSVGS